MEINNQNVMNIYEENIRLKDKLHKITNKNQEMLMFADFSNTLRKSSNIEEISEFVMNRMSKLINGKKVTFVRKEAKKDIYAFYYNNDGNIIKEVMSRSEFTKECIFIYCKNIIVGNKNNPFVAVPIKHEGENLAVIIVDDIDAKKVTPTKKRMFELFASYSGSVIKNALLKIQLMKEKSVITNQHEKITDDLLVAQKVQKSILPSQYKRFDEYVYYGDYIQSHYLGGDFYDFFKLDNDLVIFYIADVSGHGVASSLLTVFLRQAVRGISKSLVKKEVKILPQNIITRLQTRFNDLNIDDTIYIGILIGVLNTKDNKIVLANAGHNVEPIHVRDFSVKLYELEGLPINNWFNDNFSSFYEETEFSLEKGESLILLTDGAIEAKDEKGEMIGINKIKKIINANRKLKQKLQFDILVRSVYRHTGDNKLEDDIAYVGIKRDA